MSSSSEQRDKTSYVYAPSTVDHEAKSGQKASQQQQQQQQIQQPTSRAKGSPLKRARIIITVKRTPEYKRWLDENPSQEIIAAAGGDVENIEPHPAGAPSRV